MTTVMTTSLQPSQPPQATGTAASTARNGTTMNTASATCSLRDWWSPPSVAPVAGEVVAVVGGAVGGPWQVACGCLGDGIVSLRVGRRSV